MSSTTGQPDCLTDLILLSLPNEVLLHILSYLDLPDLDSLAVLCPTLSVLSSDPILHRHRLRIITPLRLQHFLFAHDYRGELLRPSIADLARMNVMRGLQIERRWRLGSYLYSVQSVKQYESVLRLEHIRIVRVLTSHFSKRSNTLSSPNTSAPSEAGSPLVSRRLLPVIASLKWSMARDRLARGVRAKAPERGMITDVDHFKSWLEGRGRRVMQESERVRLAICPGIRRTIKRWEGLAASAPV